MLASASPFLRALASLRSRRAEPSASEFERLRFAISKVNQIELQTSYFLFRCGFAKAVLCDKAVETNTTRLFPT
jgi:hypothetical protein